MDIVGVASLVGLQAALIAGLLTQRSRQRKADEVVRGDEADLRSSHARIRDLAGRLITAQEAERKRIARDLHDDVCQDIAGIAVDLSTLLRRRGNLQDADVQRSLAAVHSRVADVAESLRLLSHDLHPSVLQHIGLVAALEAHCAEAERLHDMEISFSALGEVEPTPAVALALFRIAQEALRNAGRHGHARHAAVTLARHDGDLTMSVRDDGVGFDLAAARHQGGLGLVSIEERARLVNGQVLIRSQVGQGTTIEVRAAVDGDDPKHFGQGSARTLSGPEKP